uniref:Uncharacterized protein n=1 Tax=Ditylenchus dipsaci TaxID=166011 RepID=A0A915EAS9_9BILA
MFLPALIITNKLSLKTILSKSAVRKQVRRIRIRNRIPVVEARRVEDVQIPAARDSGAQIADPERGTLEGEDRTNNFAEAARRKLQDALGVEHPTVGRLLADLKRIQRILLLFRLLS